MAATIPAPSPAPVLPPDIPPHRITREEFSRFGESGAFGDRDFELLDGELYEAMSTDRPHRSATRRAARALRAAFGEAYDVSQEMELPLGPSSQPRPDVLVLRGDLDEFDARDEGPEDVALLVEIVDSRADTAAIKRGLYAAAGVPEYWILDVNARTLQVHRDPRGGEYRDVRTLGEGERTTALEAGSGEIAVADLLP